MIGESLLTMELTTTMPYYYKTSLTIWQDENRVRSLFVVHKKQRGVRGVSLNTLLFDFQSNSKWGYCVENTAVHL